MTRPSDGEITQLTRLEAPSPEEWASPTLLQALCSAAHRIFHTPISVWSAHGDNLYTFPQSTSNHAEIRPRDFTRPIHFGGHKVGVLVVHDGPDNAHPRKFIARLQRRAGTKQEQEHPGDLNHDVLSVMQALIELTFGVSSNAPQPHSESPRAQMYARLNHELRTPLTSILGYSDLLYQELVGPLNKEQKSYVHTIMKRGDELLDIFTAFLDYFQAEENTDPPLKKQTRVRDLLEHTKNEFAAKAKERGVRIEIECAPGLVATVAASSILQALHYLVDNAIKFSLDNGRVKLRAAMVRRVGNDALEVIVEDNGVGITDEAAPNVFEPFYQADGGSTREHRGLGLGLAIVRRMVESAAGTIQLDSRIGHGTTIFLRMPIA